jgi:hypothetical protein
MTDLCDYGCGTEAKYKLKNGKNCCSKSTSSCDGMKEINRSKIKNLRKDLGNNYWKNGHPKGSSKGTSLKGKTYDEIFGEQGALIQKEKLRNANLGKSFWNTLSEEKQQEFRDKHREIILKRYEDGWMPKAGRCKKIRYFSPIAGEVLLDGTWELKAAQYMDAKKWNWKRNTERFAYINLSGKISHYTPDFYVEELGGYLEVKGYETELDRCKWKQFKNNLTIWKKDTIYNITESGQDGNAAAC